MDNSKTIQTIQDYYNIVKRDFNDLNKDEQFFCCNIEIDLAKSILQEFGDTSAKKVGKILLGVCEWNSPQHAAMELDPPLTIGVYTKTPSQ